MKNFYILFGFIKYLSYAVIRVSLADEGHLTHPSPISLNALIVSGWYCKIAPISVYFEITMLSSIYQFDIIILLILVS